MEGRPYPSESFDQYNARRARERKEARRAMDAGCLFLTNQGWLQPGADASPLVIPAGTVITPELLANPMTFGVVVTEGKLTFEDVLVSLRQVESAGSPGDAAFLRSLGIEP